MKTVIVPQIDIDNVGQARKELWELIDSIESATIHGKLVPNEYLSTAILAITNSFWYLTHRRYRQTFFSWIRNKFQRKVV